MVSCLEQGADDLSMVHPKATPFWILMKQEVMGGIGISWTIADPLHFASDR